MSHNIQVLIRSVFSSALVVLVLGVFFVAAQTTVTGDWKASVKTENTDKIHLSFERRTEKGGKNQMGSSYEYSALQGLSREQASANGAVKFSLVREAGTIDCEGSFQNGRGSGTFRFTANPSFVSAMKSRGFDFEKSSKINKHGDDDEQENRLFAATTLNVTTVLADDLLSANLGNLDVDDLFKAAIFKVDSKFMREMKASGFPNLDMEDLVKARIFKVDANFVREVREMGFKEADMESLTKLRIFKVTPAFIKEVQDEGLANLSIEQLVQLRIFRVDGEFIRQAKTNGSQNLSVENLVQMRIMGKIR
jgi:hypothetical protein